LAVPGLNVVSPYLVIPEASADVADPGFLTRPILRVAVLAEVIRFPEMVIYPSFLLLG
jgi:hypothetical protein